ncbi:MAG: peptidoglycan DD-metalloendopeptidase family protein [Polaribacter sp.]|uniref:murein hydrolase activator EnvC family protein n=1 Tax=Polaribacter sp. TaxID=1920175 RepID=UPI003BAE5CCA
MKNKSFFIVFFTLFMLSVSAFSQTKKQLEEQRLKYKSEIQKLNSLISSEKKKEKNALDDLSDINLKIDMRNQLITTIKAEAKILSIEIKAKEKKLKRLNNNLKDLKEDYASMIFKSYKSKSQQSRTMFLLSSQNFYQAYKRLEYMKQYRSFRKKQGEEIEVQASIVKSFKDSLVSQKKVKETLLVTENNQKKEIELDKKKQEELITIIKRKESKYRKDLQNSIKQEKIIADKIDKLIREAIAKANKEVKNQPVSASKDEFILSPEAKALAAKFELNKAKLPWPVKESIITRKFGVQPHPTIGGITINSTGLHFATRENSYAESIFDGIVLGIQLTAEGRKNVLIQHGNYISTYKNLETSLVKKGDKVNTGERIGKIFTNKVTGKTTLIFVLFKNTTRLNPSEWILKL